MNYNLPLSDSIALLFAGALGALAKDCVIDNTLELPFIHGKKLYLGFIGATLVGAFIGYVVDGSMLTAAMGGYTGSSILKSLLIDGRDIKSSHLTVFTGSGLKADRPNDGKTLNGSDVLTDTDEGDV